MNNTDIQRRLTELGYYHGAIDGIWGPASETAIRAFQKAVGLQGTGSIGPKTIAALSPPTRIEAMPPWIVMARRYVGTLETPGPGDNPLISEMYTLAGSPGIKHDAVPWCAAFVSAMLEKVGVRSARTLWAPSYAAYGQQLQAPIYGCIGVKMRKGGGHVTFIVGQDGNRVFGLGGNQSDSVSIAAFSRSDFIAWRWPAGVPIPVNPKPMPATIAGAKSGVSEA